MKFKTNAGTASFPFLEHARFCQAGNAYYDTKLILSQQDAQPLIFMCESIADTELKSSDNASINIPFNKKDNGNCIFYFNSKHKPVIFDINGMIITKNPEIESGSIIRVFGSFKFRKEAKKIYAFLNAVMVIERKPSLALKDYHYEKMHTAG